jgi:hypothetical protein
MVVENLLENPLAFNKFFYSLHLPEKIEFCATLGISNPGLILSHAENYTHQSVCAQETCYLAIHFSLPKFPAHRRIFAEFNR